MNLENEKVLSKKKELLFNRMYDYESKIRSLREIKEITRNEKSTVLYYIEDNDYTEESCKCEYNFVSLINHSGNVLFSDFTKENGVRNEEKEKNVKSEFKYSNIIITFDKEYLDGGANFFKKYYNDYYYSKADKISLEWENLENIIYKLDLAKEFMILNNDYDKELEFYSVPSIIELFERYNYTEDIESDTDLLFGLKHCIDNGMIDDLIKHFETEKNKIEVLFIETTKQLERINLNS